MRKLSCFMLFAIFGAFFNLTVSAQSSIQLLPFLSGLSEPVFVTNAGDDTNRLFVVEKGGVIKVVQPGSTVPTVFLDISSTISTSGEQGLLGLAFHPLFETNRRFFVYYTRASDGAIQIAEYQASTGNPNVADSAESIIITIPHPTFENHNGGTIAFGTDGFLYAGTGDGGSGNDPSNNAQNINSLLGKFIRLDINSGAPYSIPGDNPFAGATAGADEIYAVGVRNPYRFSFDRGSGALYAGDVGQNAIEEVDIITKGGNYGWRVYEGTQCTNIDPTLCNPANFVAPVIQYSSADMSGRCSITGGYVYRGTRGTLAAGTYIYGDYCTGEILTGAAQNLLLATGRSIVSFGEDEAGELYVVDIGGTVEKLAPLGATAATVTVGGRVTTATGRGIRNILVRMTDSRGNVRSATTTSFGYYNFADVVVGETYIITAKGKRYTFEQYLQVVNINDDTNSVDFIANQ